MTRLVVLVAVVLAAWSPEPPRAEPAGTCWGVQPVCPPGRSPICLCESDYSLRCQWVCGSVGR